MGFSFIRRTRIDVRARTSVACSKRPMAVRTGRSFSISRPTRRATPSNSLASSASRWIRATPIRSISTSACTTQPTDGCAPATAGTRSARQICHSSSAATPPAAARVSGWRSIRTREISWFSAPTITGCTRASTEAGSFSAVASFPVANAPHHLRLLRSAQRTPGSPTQTIYAGVASTAAGTNIYRSIDGGASWSALTGGTDRIHADAGNAGFGWESILHVFQRAPARWEHHQRRGLALQHRKQRLDEHLTGDTGRA